MFPSNSHDNGPFDGAAGPFSGSNGFGSTPPPGGAFGSNDGFDADMFGLESLDLASLLTNEQSTVDVGLHFHGAMRDMQK